MKRTLRNVPPLYGSKCQCGHIAGDHRHFDDSIECRFCLCQQFKREDT